MATQKARMNSNRQRGVQAFAALSIWIVGRLIAWIQALIGAVHILPNLAFCGSRDGEPVHNVSGDPDAGLVAVAEAIMMVVRAELDDGIKIKTPSPWRCLSEISETGQKGYGAGAELHTVLERETVHLG